MAQTSGGGGCNGPSYTYAQLQSLWINAGGDRKLAPLMAAIAEAESGGCAAAVNPDDNNGTQTSWGLWQISDGTHGQPAANILDPNVNAQQALAKYNSQGLGAWGTYTSGAYKKFMSGKTTPDPNVPPATTQTTSQTTSETCVVKLPKIGLGPLSVGGECMFSKTEARALIGAMILAAGGMTITVALAVAVVSAFRKSPAARGASRVLKAVPGPQAQIASRAVAGKQRDRRDESVAREVEGRRRDSARGPALRDDDNRSRTRRLANPRVSEAQRREPVPF